MSTLGERILVALGNAPAGLTSRQLADAVGKPMPSVSSCASKMHMTGKLERKSIRERRTYEHEAVLWRVKKDHDQ